MTTYEPMDIAIVSEGRSTRPEPTIDPQWSRIDQLRWRAGVIKARTGVVVKFNDGSKCSGPGYAYEWPELIGVQVGGWSSSFLDSKIDVYLRGVEVGAEAAQRE